MKYIFLLVGLFFTFYANAQDYITRNGNISFSSHTPLEDVNAENNEVASTLNSATGAFEFKAAIKSFHFKKQTYYNKWHYNYKKWYCYSTIQF